MVKSMISRKGMIAATENPRPRSSSSSSSSSSSPSSSSSHSSSSPRRRRRRLQRRFFFKVAAAAASSLLFSSAAASSSHPHHNNPDLAAAAAAPGNLDSSCPSGIVATASMVSRRRHILLPNLATMVMARVAELMHPAEPGPAAKGQPTLRRREPPPPSRSPDRPVEEHQTEEEYVRSCAMDAKIKLEEAIRRQKRYRRTVKLCPRDRKVIQHIPLEELLSSYGLLAPTVHPKRAIQLLLMIAYKAAMLIQQKKDDDEQGALSLDRASIGFSALGEAIEVTIPVSGGGGLRSQKKGGGAESSSSVVRQLGGLAERMLRCSRADIFGYDYLKGISECCAMEHTSLDEIVGLLESAPRAAWMEFPAKVWDSLNPRSLQEITVQKNAVLGKGLFGCVSTAATTIAGKREQVAAKVFDLRTLGCAAVCGVVTEALALHKLSDVRQVVGLKGVFGGLATETGGNYLILAMENVESCNLQEYIASTYNNPPDLSFRLDLCYELAKGLSAMHSRGVLHGDIKPENIILARDLRPLYCDFGLAAIIDPKEPLSASSMGVVGTPWYTAPEVTPHWGDRVHVPRIRATDVYAFGVLLTDILSWSLETFPLGTEVDWSVEEKDAFSDPILNPVKEVAWLQDVDKPLADFVLSCCDPESAKRPTAEEIVHFLGKRKDALDLKYLETTPAPLSSDPAVAKSAAGGGKARKLSGRGSGRRLSVQEVAAALHRRSAGDGGVATRRKSLSARHMRTAPFQRTSVRARRT